MTQGRGTHLTYANVMATVAVFIALGGGAYAVSLDSVKSKHIVDDEIKSQDIRDGRIKGEDVKDDNLTGVQIDEATFDPGELPGTSGFAAQIRDLGGGGTTEYGAAVGISEAAASMATVQMAGRAGMGMDIQGMTVHLDTAPGSGESRTFSVVRRGVPDGTILTTSLECTISEGERFCTDDDDQEWNLNANLFAIEIESVGAGLPTTDEAYVGVGVGG